jgi:hypothetical protein
MDIGMGNTQDLGQKDRFLPIARQVPRTPGVLKIAKCYRKLFFGMALPWRFNPYFRPGLFYWSLA